MTARAELIPSQEPGVFSWVSHTGGGAQGMETPFSVFPCHKQGSELQVEQPTHKQVPIWHARAAGRSLPCQPRHRISYSFTEVIKLILFCSLKLAFVLSPDFHHIFKSSFTFLTQCSETCSWGLLYCYLTFGT